MTSTRYAIRDQQSQLFFCHDPYGQEWTEHAYEAFTFVTEQHCRDRVKLLRKSGLDADLVQLYVTHQGAVGVERRNR